MTAKASRQRPTANNRFLIFRNLTSIFTPRALSDYSFLKQEPAPGLTPRKYVSVSSLHPAGWTTGRNFCRLPNVLPQENNSSGNRTRPPALPETDWPAHGCVDGRC